MRTSPYDQLTKRSASCPLRSRRGDASLGRWVHFGNESSYVALQENSRPGGRRDTTYENDGINHIGFNVTGLDEIMARLDEAGYELK